VQDLIDEAKKNPGKLTNASSSNGSPGHVRGRTLQVHDRHADRHVPYKGGAMAINDLIAGHVPDDVGKRQFDRPPRALGPRARDRDRQPAALVGLSGHPDDRRDRSPGYEATTWSGVIAPAGLPRPIVDKLNSAVNAAIRSPIFKERFEANGDESGGGTPGRVRRTDPQGLHALG
jgi:tripartite-type tricarboxylate transporter receptor subunit TctC